LIVANFDEHVDFVIAGSGGGSMCAALLAKQHNFTPLILEKTDLIGGSTSLSGGVMWVPANSVMNEAGANDTEELGLIYLNAVAGAPTPGSTDGRRKTFIHRGPETVDFLRRMGIELEWNDGYSDYYDDRPGGNPRGRSLSAKMFDLTRLGEAAANLRITPFDVPATLSELISISLARRTWRGKLAAARVGFRLAAQKLSGRRFIGCGTALQARMMEAAIRQGIEIRRHVKVEDFLLDQGKVCGVVADDGTGRRRIGAKKGVLINAGGFARNAEMRRQFGPQPSSVDWTNANPGDTGELIEAAMRLGAAVAHMEEAWWNMVSLPPGSETLRAIHVPDLGKPGSIVVDSSGARFANEAASYMEFGQSVYRRHKTVPSVPCWYVFDGRCAKRYPMFLLKGADPQKLIACGYLKRAETPEALAALCGMNKDVFRSTLTTFNAAAAIGVDREFKRGARKYDHYYGDPTNEPNPTLGPLDMPPYSAIAVYPGDVGTAGGVVTDEYARVLREDGSVIEGLYATGNSTASVMGASYPGPGASVAASFVFGYIAAGHALAV
jgi:3-oxosteroid 1-dehydrogenase